LLGLPTGLLLDGNIIPMKLTKRRANPSGRLVAVTPVLAPAAFVLDPLADFFHVPQIAPLVVPAFDRCRRQIEHHRDTFAPLGQGLFFEWSETSHLSKLDNSAVCNFWISKTFTGSSADTAFSKLTRNKRFLTGVAGTNVLSPRPVRSSGSARSIEGRPSSCGRQERDSQDDDSTQRQASSFAKVCQLSQRVIVHPENPL